MSMFKDLLNNIKSKIAEGRKEANDIVKETGAVITSDPNDPSKVDVYMPTAREKQMIENITEHKTDDSKCPTPEDLASERMFQRELRQAYAEALAGFGDPSIMDEIELTDSDYLDSIDRQMCTNTKQTIQEYKDYEKTMSKLYDADHKDHHTMDANPGYYNDDHDME